MATADSVKEKIQGLIDRANTATGNADADLTTAVDALVAGFGQGADPVLAELTVSENGEYTPEEGVDGFNKVTVEVESSGGSYTDEQITALVEGRSQTFAIPKGCTKIRSYMFYSSMQKITSIPDSVVQIGNSAFMNTTTVTVSALPEGVTSIGPTAFSGCRGIRLTKLPGALTTLGAMAFQGCSGLAITEIPASVTSFGKQAFGSCSGLEKITFRGTPPDLPSDTFYGSTNLLTINVPWAEGEVANAPWGATNATINYDYTEG